MKHQLLKMVLVAVAMAWAALGSCDRAAASANTNVEQKLRQLDSCMQQKALFDQRKQKRIDVLREGMKTAHDAERKYETCRELFLEYESFNYDSAFHYAREAEKLALALGNRNYQVAAGCAIVFCHLSAGLYKEAFDAMTAISPESVDSTLQQEYYMMWTRLYYDFANYNNSQPYEQFYVSQGNLYTDTLLNYLPEGSVYWYYAQAQRQMKSHDFNASVQSFQKLVESGQADAHMLAIAYSCIGWNHWIEGREDEAIANLAESALCDIKSSIKENTSACSLANILYKKGDIRRAVSYAQSALEDANFYGARHRKIEIGQILPIIEQDRYRLMERQRNLSFLAVGIAVLFILVLGAATVIIRRQVRKLHHAQQTISKHNQALLKANEQLEEANHSLEEADRIKTVYIGKSFYLNAEYINKVEKLYKMVDRKIAARQFDDLRAQLKESTLQAERKTMFADFDETFLKLFPDFVDKFNQLFEEKDRRQPESDKSLTSEMRIFALIRLGVSDSERIANFLDYSVHTVNTYKTRVKNRSTIDNELFEERIKSI